MSKYIKYLVFFSLLVFDCSCGLIDYGNAVKKDTIRIFSEKRKFINSLSFYGCLKEKKSCSKCDLNRYTLTIKIDSLNHRPTISNAHFPPYYFFYTDSVLVISVSKRLYDFLNEDVYIKKDSNSNNIFIHDKSFPLLSDKDTRWIP